MTTENQNTQSKPANQALSDPAGSVRRRNSVLPLAMSIMASAGAWAMPSGLKMVRRHSSYAERHDPNREKTPEDLERIEAAKRKQERKAAKRQKFSSQNVEHDHPASKVKSS